MAKASFSKKIEAYFERSEWKTARELLESERKKSPEDHWLITQLGVTFYEERKYDHALQLFLEALELKRDCPLTLWNLAGAFDALGDVDHAISVYRWLLTSETTPEQDPCWENEKWSASIKMDSLYRLGLCFRKTGKKSEAAKYYRQYLDLLLAGVDGSYSSEEVTRSIRELRGHAATKTEVREALNSALKTSAISRRKNERDEPPSFNEHKLIASRRVVNKK